MRTWTGHKLEDIKGVKRSDKSMDRQYNGGKKKKKKKKDKLLFITHYTET